MKYHFIAWLTTWAKIGEETWELHFFCEMELPFVPYVGLRYRHPAPEEFEEQDSECLQEQISDRLHWNCDAEAFVDFMRLEWEPYEDGTDKAKWTADTIETYTGWGWTLDE